MNQNKPKMKVDFKLKITPPPGCSQKIRKTINEWWNKKTN